MGKTEIVILIFTILVSVLLLSIFLNKALKQKPKKAKEKENKVEEKTSQEKTEEVLEPVKEEVKEVKKEEKQSDISIALQNELDEFKDYLKSRVTKAPNDDSITLHPYDTPKLNSSFDDFPQDFFDDDFNPKSYKIPQKNDDLESLPNKIKTLLFTDFFDTKF